MLKYRVHKFKNPLNPNLPSKYHARLIHESISDEDFVKHLSSHNTTFTEGTYRAVITDCVSCLRELLLTGKSVQVGGLGIFSLTCSSVGSDTRKDNSKDDRSGFHPQNIYSLQLHLRVGKRLKSASLFADATFREASVYTAEDPIADEGEYITTSE